MQKSNRDLFASARFADSSFSSALSKSMSLSATDLNAYFEHLDSDTRNNFISIE